MTLPRKPQVRIQIDSRPFLVFLNNLIRELGIFCRVLNLERYSI